MVRRLSFMLVTVLLAAAADARDDPARADRDGLQGTWSVESAERRGEVLPRERAERIKLIVTADKITIQDGDTGRNEEALFQLDPTKQPKAIDLTPGGESAKVEGIYQLAGDTLKLCWSKPGGARPGDFTTSRNDNRVLFVLKRAKP
jgi:uncharacterized protein (TIGR03067 family)